MMRHLGLKSVNYIPEESFPRICQSRRWHCWARCWGRPERLILSIKFVWRLLLKDKPFHKIAKKFVLIKRSSFIELCHCKSVFELIPVLSTGCSRGRPRSVTWCRQPSAKTKEIIQELKPLVFWHPPFSFSLFPSLSFLCFILKLLFSLILHRLVFQFSLVCAWAIHTQACVSPTELQTWSITVVNSTSKKRDTQTFFQVLNKKPEINTKVVKRRKRRKERKQTYTCESLCLLKAEMTVDWYKEH